MLLLEEGKSLYLSARETITLRSVNSDLLISMLNDRERVLPFFLHSALCACLPSALTTREIYQMEFGGDDGVRVVGVEGLHCHSEDGVGARGGVIQAMGGQHLIANPDMEELHYLRGRLAFEGVEIFDDEVVLLVPAEFQVLALEALRRVLEVIEQVVDLLLVDL